MFWFFRTLVFIVVKLFFPTKVSGRENLIDKGCIIVCNHQSGWDIPIVYTSIPYKMFILGKKEVVNGKILGGLFKKLGAIPVDRENVAPSTIKEIIKKLKAGNKLVLFPEGTRRRTEDGIMSALKNGAALFSLSTGVPIIPTMIDKKPRLFRRNIFMIGKPIYFEGLKANKEDIAKASEIIKNKMEEVKQEINRLKKH